MSPLRDVSRCIGTFTWGAAATAVGFSAYAIITLSAPMTEPISPPIAGLASSARQRFLLEVSPSRVALGELKAGQSARAEITLRNPGLAPVTVDRVVSSCPCITVSPLPACVPCSGSAVLVVAFDPADEPEFRGGLSVELSGRGAADSRLFEAVVEFEIGENPVQSGTERLELRSLELVRGVEP